MVFVPFAFEILHIPNYSLRTGSLQVLLQNSSIIPCNTISLTAERRIPYSSDSVDPSDSALRSPALSRGRTGFGALRVDELTETEPALSRENRAALRAQAADKLAEIVLADPGACWARFALEVVLR